MQSVRERRLTPCVLSGIADGRRGRVRAVIGLGVGVAVHVLGGRGDAGGALVIGLERR